MPVTRDDFLTWRENPVTKWVFQALETAAAETKTAWVEASWHHKVSSPELLLELKTREDAYRALIDTTYERFCEIFGEEPTEE